MKMSAMRILNINEITEVHVLVKKVHGLLSWKCQTTPTDYHWYIQNRDGYWSHKRGLEEISNLDASGKKITDPQTCNRNYGNNFNYSVFCGYYLVKY